VHALCVCALGMDMCVVLHIEKGMEDAVAALCPLGCQGVRPASYVPPYLHSIFALFRSPYSLPPLFNYILPLSALILISIRKCFPDPLFALILLKSSLLFLLSYLLFLLSLYSSPPAAPTFCCVHYLLSLLPLLLLLSEHCSSNNNSSYSAPPHLPPSLPPSL